MRPARPQRDFEPCHVLKVTEHSCRDGSTDQLHPRRCPLARHAYMAGAGVALQSQASSLPLIMLCFPQNLAAYLFSTGNEPSATRHELTAHTADARLGHGELFLKPLPTSYEESVLASQPVRPPSTSRVFRV